jgi:hypothetical protein
MTITGIQTVRGPAVAATGANGVPIAVGVAGSYGAAGPLVSGTSNTPNTIDTVVNKSFAINETNRSFFPGTRLRATVAPPPTNVWLEGIVTAWDGATVTIDGDLASGTGAYSNWQINCAGQPGVQGVVGPVGPQGPSGGPAGPQGPQGTPGSVWRNGNGAPANSLGANGDYYLDDTNGNVWLRAASAYTVISNIQGPTGATGVAGVTGPQGVPGSVWRTGSGTPANTLGVDGDYYLDSANGNVWLRATGIYSIVANIKGPTGLTGPAGPAGGVGPAGGTGPAGPTGPQGSGYAATSTSSLTVVLGSATFATQSGLAYSVGARARASSRGTPTAWMEGLVTSYSGTTLIVNVDLVNGSGTHTDWNLNVAGSQGAIGPTGPSGPGTGNVSNVGTPTSGQLAQWTSATTIQGVSPASLGYAGLASPVFTGDPQAPTPATNDNDTSIATTAYVQANLAAYLALTGGALTGNITVTTASPVLRLNKNGGSAAGVAVYDNASGFERWGLVLGSSTAESGSNNGSDFALQRFDDGGTLLDNPIAIPRSTGIVAFNQSPTGPTPAASDSSNKLATTAFVGGSYAPLASPALTGNPTAPTPAPGNNTISIATTAFIVASFAPLASPILTGAPKAPTPAAASNDTSVATTAFVKSLGYVSGGPFLALTGGTLTGPLSVQYSNPQISLIKTAAGQFAAIFGLNGSNNRWAIAFGDPTAEGGSNTGSNFLISRYNDAGAGIDNPISIARNTGVVSFAASPTVPTAAAGDNSTKAASTAYADNATKTLGGLLTMQDATHLKFIPYLGNYIRIQNALYQIPDAGIVIPNTGVNVNGTPGSNLAANTTYLLALQQIGGVLTPLFYTQASNTHVTSTTPGNAGTEVIVGTGDGAVLIGMVHANSSAQFFDGENARWVRSWFNSPVIHFGAQMSAPQGFGAAGNFNSLSNTLVYFLAWANERVQISFSATCFNDTASQSCYTNIQVDITTGQSSPPGGLSYMTAVGASLPGGVAPLWGGVLTEGAHQAGVGAFTSAGNGNIQNGFISGMAMRQPGTT